MPTSTLINQHTPGPMVARISHAPRLDTPSGGVLCAVAVAQTNQTSLPTTEQLVEAERNAELLAAAYNAFDKVARKLGVDAVELAEKADLIELLEMWSVAQTTMNDWSKEEILRNLSTRFGIRKHLQSDSTSPNTTQ